MNSPIRLTMRSRVIQLTITPQRVRLFTMSSSISNKQLFQRKLKFFQRKNYSSKVVYKQCLDSISSSVHSFKRLCYLSGRRGMIVLASKMIKNYCHLFRSFGKDGFHRVSEMSNLNVQFAVHKNTCAGQPVGTIIRAATSFCVPASPTRVFNYLIDHSMRAQWDVLCNGNQVSELMRIPTGPYPSNHISILQPSNPHEDAMIFQESAMEKLGSFIIYAPFDSTSMLELATGTSLSPAPFLASGFSITPVSPDEKASASTSRRKPFPGGSVITVAFQILVSTKVSSEKMKLDWVSKADALVSRVMRVLKTAFERSD